MAHHFSNREQAIVDKVDVWLKLEGLPQYDKLYNLTKSFVQQEQDRFYFWGNYNNNEHAHVHYPDHNDESTCYFCQLKKVLDVK